MLRVKGAKTLPPLIAHNAPSTGAWGVADLNIIKLTETIFKFSSEMLRKAFLTTFRGLQNAQRWSFKVLISQV